MPQRGASGGGLANFRPAILGLGRILGLGLSAVSAAPLTARGHGGHGGPEESEGPVWVLAVASITLVLLGGAFAGLTIA